MSIPREFLEDYLIQDSEQDHRLAAHLLRPLGYYEIWEPKEVLTLALPPILNLTIPDSLYYDEFDVQDGYIDMTAKTILAIFHMKRVAHISPARYYYTFTGFH